MDEALLDRFFAGSCTEDEARAVLHWYFSNQMDEAIAARFKEYWAQETPSPQEWHAGRNFDDLTSRIPELRHQRQMAAPGGEGPEKTAMFSSAPEPAQHRRGKFHLRPLVKAAAVLIFAVCAGALGLQLWGPEGGQSELVVKSAGRGEMLKVILPDQSVVILNADSKVAFRKTFSPDKREIELEGEAFFEVTPDKARPFIVTSGNVATTALGTSFNVNCRRDSLKRRVEIALVSGRVRVVKTGEKGTVSDTHGVVLYPGQMAYLDEQLQLVKTEFNGKSVLWKEGILYFNATPFREVLNILERWYDVKITASGNNGKRLYSGEFKDETLENVLESISFSGGFRYTIDNRNVWIEFEMEK